MKPTYAPLYLAAFFVAQLASTTAFAAGNTCQGNDPTIDYNDPKFVNKVAGKCPAGSQPVQDPCTSKCIVNTECRDPDGSSPQCRGVCVNRNFFGPTERSGSPFQCLSSLSSSSQLSSGWWGNPCTGKPELEMPTNLMIDCRCTTQKDRQQSDPRFVQCKGPQAFTGTPTRVGTGPSWVELRGDKAYTGGFFDAANREFIVGARFTDSTFPKATGLVFAINVDTGNRRILSGTYPDPVEGVKRIGCGAAAADCASPQRIADDLGGVEDVRPDPKDPKSLIAYVNGAGIGTQIVRIEKATGKRTLVWAENIDAQKSLVAPSATANSDQCSNGVPATSSGTKLVQLNPMGWTMDAAGNHYFGVIPNGAPLGPTGIVRISVDGKTCSWVTRYFRDLASTSGPKNEFRGNDIGSGPTNIIADRWGALVMHDGKLWGTNASAIATVDPATGNRTVVTNAAIQGAVGTGGSIGDRWLKWDPTRKVVWATGAFNKTVIAAVDPKTGNRCDYTSPTGVNKPTDFRHIKGSLQENFMLRGGFDFDDRGEHDVLVIHNFRALVRWEVRTGNSYVVSY